MSDVTPLPALHATQPIPLTLSPAEFGVAVALTGLGIAAMTGNVPMGTEYKRILNTSDTEALAFSAFENMLMALQRVSPLPRLDGEA